MTLVSFLAALVQAILISVVFLISVVVVSMVVVVVFAVIKGQRLKLHPPGTR